MRGHDKAILRARQIMLDGCRKGGMKNLGSGKAKLVECTIYSTRSYVLLSSPLIIDQWTSKYIDGTPSSMQRQAQKETQFSALEHPDTQPGLEKKRRETMLWQAGSDSALVLRGAYINQERDTQSLEWRHFAPV